MTQVDGVAQHSVDEVKSMLEKNDVKVIDVRTEEEYASGHIPGVPLMPMQSVEEWKSKLNPTDSYVFVCRSGGRSQNVAAFLKQQGFSNVGNCVGGMMSWHGETKSGMEP